MLRPVGVFTLDLRSTGGLWPQRKVTTKFPHVYTFYDHHLVCIAHIFIPPVYVVPSKVLMLIDVYSIYDVSLWTMRSGIETFATYEYAKSNDQE